MIRAACLHSHGFVWLVPITELEPCNYINIPVASVEAIHGLLASTPQMSERLTPEQHSRPTSRRTPHLTAWTILSFASTAAVFFLCSVAQKKLEATCSRTRVRLEPHMLMWLWPLLLLIRAACVHSHGFMWFVSITDSHCTLFYRGKTSFRDHRGLAEAIRKASATKSSLE